MLLLISSLQMLHAQPPQSKPTDVSEGDAKVDAGASIAVVPLTIPLLTGPATISTMVIYADSARSLWWEEAVLVGYGVVVGVAVYLAFAASGRITRLLGRTGIDIMTRLMGLILAALAVEIMADGLVEAVSGAGQRRENTVDTGQARTAYSRPTRHRHAPSGCGAGPRKRGDKAANDKPAPPWRRGGGTDDTLEP